MQKNTKTIDRAKKQDSLDKHAEKYKTMDAAKREKHYLHMNYTTDKEILLAI